MSNLSVHHMQPRGLLGDDREENAAFASNRSAARTPCLAAKLEMLTALGGPLNFYMVMLI
jgi:hypothetical protein